MSEEKEFYPLVSHTIKILLDLTPRERLSEYLQILRYYPQINAEDYTHDKTATLIIKELDRQYNRWKSGGKNATSL